jgi:hypothetical protein
MRRESPDPLISDLVPTLRGISEKSRRSGTCFTYTSEVTRLARRELPGRATRDGAISYGADTFAEPTSVGSTAWSYVSAVGYNEYEDPLDPFVDPIPSEKIVRC